MLPCCPCIFEVLGVCAGVILSDQASRGCIFSHDVASMLRRRSIGKGLDAGWQRARVKWQGRAGSFVSLSRAFSRFSRRVKAVVNLC